MVKLRKDPSELFIEIIINKEKNTFTLRDTGMGMTRSDLIGKLSKAARSGTKEMPDQFSLGVFSAYLVANKVVVTTKHDSEEQYVWEPRANSSYTISPSNGGKSLGRGTKITLYLKHNQGAYLDLLHVTEQLKKCPTRFDHEVYIVVENSPTVREAGNQEIVPTVPESEDLELVSETTPGCNVHRFRLIKDKPLLRKRNNEGGEPEERKRRKVQQ